MSALPKVPPAPLSDWSPMLQDVRREHGFEPLRVEGTLPAELRGTLFRNGPGVFGAGADRYGHLFDGDGMITAVRLDGDRALGAARVVASPERDRELRRGRTRYGGFGTRSKWPVFDFLRGRRKNSANTSVLPWQGRLLALWEAGLPTEIDPETLATIGRVDLDGAIPQAFSAHPHRVPSRKAWFNIGLRLGKQAEVDLFELPDRGPARRLTTVPVDISLLHDFAVTEKYAVLFLNPLKMRVLDFALGRATYADSLDWLPDRGTEIVLIELDAPHEVTRFTAPAFYQWHFGNAFDDGDRVVVDFVQYPDFDTERWLRGLYAGQVDRTANGQLVRAHLYPQTERFGTSTIWDRSTEFPVIDGRFEATRARYLWTNAHRDIAAAGHGPLDRIARVDIETGAITEAELGEGSFPSEPIFVPRGEAEGDGWLLSVVYDATRDASALVILDATELEVVARAWFDQPIPMTFHGRWRDA